AEVVEERVAQLGVCAVQVGRTPATAAIRLAGEVMADGVEGLQGAPTRTARVGDDGADRDAEASVRQDAWKRWDHPGRARPSHRDRGRAGGASAGDGEG